MPDDTITDRVLIRRYRRDIIMQSNEEALPDEMYMRADCQNSPDARRALLQPDLVRNPPEGGDTTPGRQPGEEDMP